MRRRLEKLRALLDADTAIFVSNPLNVSYLSGFRGTYAYLLIDRYSAYLLTDFRYIEQAREQANGFEVIDAAGSVWGQVGRLLQEEVLAFEADHLVFSLFGKAREILPEVKFTPLISPVGKMRRVKDKDEIASIESAISLGDEAFQHIMGFIKAGIEERDIALELEFFMRNRGASGVSFEIIVASGKRSAMPHGVASSKRLEQGDIVLLDLGCVKNSYCSDLSRTVFLGSAGDEEQNVYRTVLAAQKRALEGIRAGMECKMADALARDELAAQGLKEYFGHGLGHGVGLEIHEGPSLSPASADVLEAGMVVTVEPGVYLPGKFGIRIEDVAVIEDNGCRVLTKSSKELICL